MRDKSEEISSKMAHLKNDFLIIFLNLQKYKKRENEERKNDKPHFN